MDEISITVSPDGNSLTVQSVTQGAYGNVVINTNGMLTYAPSTNFNGSDSFSYLVCDRPTGGECVSSVVRIELSITPPPPPPSTTPIIQNFPTASLGVDSFALEYKHEEIRVSKRLDLCDLSCTHLSRECGSATQSGQERQSNGNLGEFQILAHGILPN